MELNIPLKKLLELLGCQTVKLFFKEEGNNKAGFQHIKQLHGSEFANKGIIDEEQLKDLIIEALTKGTEVGTQRDRPIYKVSFNNTTHCVAITVSNNGFIVGANPTSLPKS